MARAGISHGPGGWVVLVALQWGLALVGVGLGWVLSGRIFVAMVFLGWIGGAAGWTAYLNQRRHQPLSLGAQRATALAAGVGNGLLCAAVWLASALAWPESFGEAADNLWVGTLAGGWLGMLVGLALTLCGVNAVNAPWGSLNGRSDER